VNFTPPCACGRGGALRHGGSLFEKSSAKTFLWEKFLLTNLDGTNMGALLSKMNAPMFALSKSTHKNFSQRKVFCGAFFQKSDPPRRSALPARRRQTTKKG